MRDLSQRAETRRQPLEPAEQDDDPVAASLAGLPCLAGFSRDFPPGVQGYILLFSTRPGTANSIAPTGRGRPPAGSLPGKPPGKPIVL